MSRITLTGDIAENTGQYLPTPYIGKIYLEGNSASDAQVIIHGSIFIGDYEGKVLAYNGEILSDEEAYHDILNSDVNYYLLLCYSGQDHVFFSPTSDKPAVRLLGPHQTGSNGESIYQNVVDSELNPFVAYYTSGSTKDAGKRPLILTQLTPSTDSVTKYYDEQGNELNRFTFQQSYMIADIDSYAATTHQITDSDLEDMYYKSFDHSHPGDIDDGEATNIWNEVQDLKVVMFSSTYDYFSNEGTFDDQMNNIQMLDLKTSEVSYENVIEGGVLGGKANIKYVDASDEIYAEIPLTAIDMTPYKINTITHQQVVDKFQELLDEYASYNTDAKKNRRIKNIMDNISSILVTHKQSPDLLPRLNQVAKVFPDKSPAKPIGKFYKRLRKRIATVNRAIKNSAKLRRKVFYSSKIVDQRPIPEGTEYTSLYDDGYDSTSGESTGDTYIYSNWSATNYDITSDGETSTANVVLGHYFFDYQKALCRQSNISKVYEVNKLANFGISVPYGTYRVNSSWVRRETNYSDSYTTCVFIGTKLSDDRPYPRSEYTAIRDATGNGYVGWSADNYLNSMSDTGLWDYTPYMEGSSTDRNSPAYVDGYATSLVYREFLDTSYAGTGLRATDIDEYKLMCFELLDYGPADYLDSSTYTAYGYKAYLTVKDQTKKTINQLTASARTSAEGIADYYALATESSVYNEDFDEFNQFFRENILAEYEDDPASAPWYTAPFIYVMHLDLIYDSFEGDMESMVSRATEISQQIDPVNGTPDQIKTFLDAFTTLINNAYGETIGDSSSSSLFGSMITDMESERDIAFTTHLSSDGIAMTYQQDGQTPTVEETEETADSSMESVPGPVYLT